MAGGWVGSIKKVKRLKSKLLMGNAMTELPYGTSHAIRDHTVLPVTRHTWTCPALTPASKMVLDLPTGYPRGMKGWVDLGYSAMHRPGVETAISRSQVQRPNHYTNGATYPCIFIASFHKILLCFKFCAVDYQTALPLFADASCPIQWRSWKLFSFQEQTLDVM